MREMREPFAEFIENEIEYGTLLIACGLPGTYKTETTEEISRIKGFIIHRTDLIRREILTDMDIFDEKVASNYEIRKKVYEEMFRRANESLKKEKGVILDATFVTQELRRKAASIASHQKKTFVILQTHCSKEASIARILKRTKENYESNALTEQAYLNNLKRFEKVDLNDFRQLYPTLHILHLVVDTERDLAIEWYIIGKTLLKSQD
jgi:predicted kinase